MSVARNCSASTSANTAAEADGSAGAPPGRRVIRRRAMLLLVVVTALLLVSAPRSAALAESCGEAADRLARHNGLRSEQAGVAAEEGLAGSSAVPPRPTGPRG